MKNVKICKTCVLPDTFPGIEFDESGICNFCREHNAEKAGAGIKAEYKAKFEALLDEVRGIAAHDVLVCYSGGKDSTQTVAVLRKDYGLNVLAVSIDNGFVSEQARKNIINVVENLGVDHIFFKPRYDVMARIFRHCAVDDIFAPKALEKASSICTACMGVVKYSTLRLAMERNIPLIAYGWSPGQAPVSSSIIHNNARMVRYMQRSLFDPLYKIAGDEIRPFLLEERHFRDDFRYPVYVHPLAFLEYNEEDIYDSIRQLGWEPPRDVDANSTNCLLNSLGNAVHRERLGFHPYAYELANLVREGYMDRETALARLDETENPRILCAVRKKLGMGKCACVD